MPRITLTDGDDVEVIGEIPEELIRAVMHQMHSPREAPPKLAPDALTAFRAADKAEARRKTLLWLASVPSLWTDYRRADTVFGEYEMSRRGWTRSDVAAKGFDALLTAPISVGLVERWPA